MLTPARIAVLVSGGGTNLQALLDAQRDGKMPHGEIVLVVSSRAGAYALTRAENAGVAARVLSPSCGQEPFENELSVLLREQEIDLILLAGFTVILSAEFTKQWPRRILNVHPSLIPAFCGKGMYGLRVHEAALARGVKVTGATVHFVNEIPDGGEILLQKAVEIAPDDTPETLQRRVMEQAEWQMLPLAAERVCAEIVREKEQKMTDFLEFLRATSYPGRGILVGRRCVYYFIMGRSENSRNRVFVKTEDGIRTEAHDPAKLSDPSLIIYHPVRTMGRDLVVTNGDQTDTICEHGDFRRGLMTREYEPDEPNWTPRISAIMHEDGSFELSILKRKDGRCLREFFCYEGCDEGKGYFISTYQGDGSPLPTFAGEPMEVSVPSSEEVWAALNADNRVSLYTNMNGEVKLFNKNLGD